MNSIVAATATRVQENTCPETNRQIQRQIEMNVEHFAGASDAQIVQRLRELDEEWTIERALEANAASLCVAGVGLGFTANRAFFLVPGIVGAFLLQHALQGWCPPLSLFRRMGFRTATEIDTERYALKAMRGDFDEIKSHGGRMAPQEALDAARQQDSLDR